jgi:hypothetical protein
VTATVDQLASIIGDRTAPSNLDVVTGTVVTVGASVRVDSGGRQLSCSSLVGVAVGATVWVLQVGANNIILGTANANAGWHYVGTGGEVAFQNSWVNRGGATRTTRFRLEGDVVRLEGGVKTGTAGTTIFTLPAGFRPAFDVVTPVRVNDATELLAYLNIPGGTGNVSVFPSGAAGAIDAVDFFVTFGLG